MFRIVVVRLIAAASLLFPGVASAREYVLDYRGTLALASERAPAVLAARARIREAEARRVGASVRLPNPELELQAGPRRQGDQTSTDLEVRIGQSFELGGRRGARLAAAGAAIAREQAAAEDALRLVLREVALAYVRGLAAAERLRLASSVEVVAGEILAVAEKRLARGDLVRLDVNLAASTAARARSAVRAAEADREAALGELRALLALAPGDTLALAGDLAARRSHDPDALLAAARGRADLGVLDAERAEGQAEAELGEAYRWPDLGLALSYAREEDADVILGGVTLTLPLFERGQEHRAVGRARAARATLEQDGLARAIDAQVRAALAVYQRRVAAVDEYETHVLPLLDENDRLLRRGFEAGQMGLADYLVARRELLEARREYLERLLEMAEAAIELDAAAGVLR